MAASVQDLRSWFMAGVKGKATHMIIVCDEFDFDDYPVYVQEGEDPRKIVQEKTGKNAQRLMEVYNLKKDMESQLKPGTRVFNYE